MKKQLLKIITPALVAGLMFSCAPKTEQTNADAAATESSHPLGQASVVDDESAKNILQVAISSEAHTTLVAAVQAAQIEHVLVNAGPLTVFAPRLYASPKNYW